jgi:hypothetical protein
MKIGLLNIHVCSVALTFNLLKPRLSKSLDNIKHK